MLSTTSASKRVGVSSFSRSDDPEFAESASAAVALGWQMAELYDNPLPAVRSSGSDDDEKSDSGATGTAGEVGKRAAAADLPGISELTTREKVRLRIDQVDRGLRLLGTRITDAGLTVPNGAAVNAAMSENKPPKDVREVIHQLHVGLLTALTAADFRLGKAYGLGRAVCDTARSSQSVDDLKSHLQAGRLNTLISWCEDLKTVLPAHVGQPVADSLRRWRDWSSCQSWDKADASDISERLHRQGERWRAILTAEKDPVELLTTSTYVDAAEQLLADTARIGWRLTKKLWAPLLLAAFLLSGGLVVILLGSGNNIVAGLASIATSLGITWKTVTPNLANLARKLGEPLWGAELDTAIAVALTEPAPVQFPMNEKRKLGLRWPVYQRPSS